MVDVFHRSTVIVWDSLDPDAHGYQSQTLCLLIYHRDISQNFIHFCPTLFLVGHFTIGIFFEILDIFGEIF